MVAETCHFKIFVHFGFLFDLSFRDFIVLFHLSSQSHTTFFQLFNKLSMHQSFMRQLRKSPYFFMALKLSNFCPTVKKVSSFFINLL